MALCMVVGSILGKLQGWAVEKQENVFKKQETKQTSDPKVTVEGSLMALHA